jgi:SAM-dependent methyltransferase
VPAEGIDLDEYLHREFGYTMEYAHSDAYPLRVAGQGLDTGTAGKGGVDRRVSFSPHRRVVNTLDAFVLLQLASPVDATARGVALSAGGEEASASSWSQWEPEPGLQNDLVEVLSRGYFEDAEDISDRSVLRQIGASLGMPPALLETVLPSTAEDGGSDGSSRIETAVRDLVMAAYHTLKSQVTDIPHMMIRSTEPGASRDGVHMVGNRSVQEYERALKTIAQKTMGVDVPAPGLDVTASMFVPGANPTSPESLALPALRGYERAGSWEEAFDAGDFVRENNDDTAMKDADAPNLSLHLDGPARDALTDLYRTVLLQAGKALLGGATDGLDCLDICSSWLSHYPEELFVGGRGDNGDTPLVTRLVAMGLNMGELAANKQATDVAALDFNDASEAPLRLPYEDNSFDFVSCVSGAHYLTQPREVMIELHRVMRPGGMAVFAFSNRSFVEKTVAIWNREIYDSEGQVAILADYFRYAVATGQDGREGFRGIAAFDLSPGAPNGAERAEDVSDPLWVVSAVKA